MGLSIFLKLHLVYEHELYGKSFLVYFYIKNLLLYNFFMLFMTVILKQSQENPLESVWNAGPFKKISRLKQFKYN